VLADVQTAASTEDARIRNELPQTASLIPTVAIAGILSLASGLVLWRWRQMKP